MKQHKSFRTLLLPTVLILLVATPLGGLSAPALAQSGGGGSKVDTIKVGKCYYDAPSMQMLMKASSSDPTAHLYAYRPDGTYQGEIQNGGGSRYGGTFLGWIPYDPGTMVVRSSKGGVIIVPTTPFQI